MALALAGALGAALTTPFTGPADAVTALALVALAAAVLARWPLRAEPVPLVAPGSGAGPLVAWGVLILAVVAWELVEYLAPGGRAAHPTLSSMLNALDRQRPLKALVFLAWLALGWMIVRAGEPGRARRTRR